MYLSLLNENINKVKEEYKNKPFFVYLSLTNVCNANCIFCDVRQNKEKLCSVDVYKLIDEFADLGTRYIHFTGGGEPFMDNNIISYMQYASSKGLEIIFITNGFLLKNQISKLVNINLKAVFVSIDSSDPKIHNKLRRTNNLFENAANGINELKKIKPLVKINLNHVINSENIDYFEDFIKLKEKINFDFINPILIKDCKELTPTDEQVAAFNKNKQHYLDLIKKYNISLLCDNLNIFNENIDENGARLQNDDMRCFFANFAAFVDCPTGLVYPCDCSIHRDRILYCLGDLHKASFKEIWNDNKRKGLLVELNNGKLNCKAKCDEANCIFNRCYLKED